MEGMPAQNKKFSTATFDLMSCRNMLSKLGREIGRASAAIHREDLADHCTNAAWTAWHLVERVWADIAGDLKVKAALAEEANSTLRDFDMTAFVKFVRSESQCPELRNCRLIANASKHIRAYMLTGDPAFVIDASLTGSLTPSSSFPSGELDWLPVYDDGRTMRWAFKIVKGEVLDGEDRTNAVHLFEKVRGYWAQFIDGHGIASG